MDTLAATAAEADRIARKITAAELAEGFNHLARLRKGGEPDYEQRGLGTAYLLYYAVRRAGVIAAALVDQELTAGPVRVLDIGSGTDATSLALATLFPGHEFVVDAVEPSREMATAGTELASLLPFPVTHTDGWLEDVLSGAALTSATYDLVVASAVLPYGWDLRRPTEKVIFGDQLERRLAPGGRLLVIEPRAKAIELAIFGDTLERTNIVQFQRSLHPVDRTPVLPALTVLIRDWLDLPGFESSLTIEAADMIDAAQFYGLGAQLADIAILGTRDIAARRVQGEAQATRSTPVYTRAPRSRSPRTTVITQVPRRSWLIAAAIALASAALAASAAIAIL